MKTFTTRTTCITAAMAALLVITLLPQLAAAQTTKTATVKVAWDYPDPPPDLAGFRLYQTDISGQYTIGKGNEVASALAAARTLSLPGVLEGRHYWVLTAYDSNGNESPPSEEVTTVIDKTAPPQPGDVTVEVEVVVSVTVQGKQ